MRKILVFSLAAALLTSPVLASSPDEPRGKLEMVEFIHYKKGSAKPDWARGPKTSSCYGFIAKGAKLIETESILVNAANSGMPESEVLAGTVSSATAWDDKTGKPLFGTIAPDATANFDSSADGKNELSFGNYSGGDVIAVARVWGIFSGPPSSRYIAEFDILFDTDYNWGNAIVNPSLMDYRNIATHEIGHGVGLSDQYDLPCSQVTMYGYSTEGETKKSDLEPADIQGLQVLYGL